MERAVILGRGILQPADLPESLQHQQRQKLVPGNVLDEIERETILAALQSCGNNRRLAAEQLGISKRTLQYRLKSYGLIGE